MNNATIQLTLDPSCVTGFSICIKRLQRSFESMAFSVIYFCVVFFSFICKFISNRNFKLLFKVFVFSGSSGILCLLVLLFGQFALFSIVYKAYFYFRFSSFFRLVLSFFFYFLFSISFTLFSLSYSFSLCLFFLINLFFLFPLPLISISIFYFLYSLFFFCFRYFIVMNPTLSTVSFRFPFLLFYLLLSNSLGLGLCLLRAWQYL